MGGRASWSWTGLLVALLLLPLMLGDAITRYAVAAPSPGLDSAKKDKDGLKLFHESLSWSSDELVRIRSLQLKDITDRQAFLNSTNLAQYLGLAPVESIHMPLPLNFVFVGFAGDGNMGVNFSAHHLQKWFGHLDHVLPHSRIELAELSCVEDGYCSGQVHGRFQARPVHSAVHLNFSCHVSLVQQRSVAASFERAIHLFSRPVDPDLETGAQQVDATKMEAFVDHFISSLGLASEYTMLVLNPTWSAAEPMYGYRQGVSQKELEHVTSVGQDAVRQLLQQPLELEPNLPLIQPRNQWTRGGGWFQGHGDNSKFQVKDAAGISDSWVQGVDAYLKQEEDVRSALLKRMAGIKGGAAVVQAVRVLRRLEGPLATTLRQEVLGDPHVAAAKLLSRFRTMHPAEDCLVGHWVGHGRWLMLDLTAAGSDWGPALGGEGVVNPLTMPKLATYFSSIVSAKKDKRQRARYEGSHESEVYQSFQADKSQAIASTSNSEYQAFMLRRQVWEHDAQAPGAEPVDVKLELELWGKKYKEALARSELDALERFALRHCHQQQYPPLMCSDLKEDAEKLRTQLAKMTSSGAVTTELYPKHMWEIFGFGEHLSDDFMGLSEEAARARSFFMAELAGVLSKGLRHVVAPPTAVWRHDALGAHDVATPFAREVTFEVYSIVETSRHFTDNQVSSIFDIAAFKDEVKKLRLGLSGSSAGGGAALQTFHFNVRTLNLLDEPLLAAAFAVSLRSSTQEIPSTDQFMEEDAERTYMDSRELAHHMRPLLRLHSEEAGHHAAHDEDRLVIPVLIFQLERSSAVLIDEHYNAKALEDMVLVVQNAAREDEHPSGMMCNGALLSRPLSPLKEALAAVLLYLGGVLPPHLGYSPSKQHVAHDWLWSVGAHPLSVTSTGLSFTQTQKDALARSYLLDALDSSIESINSGVSALQAAHSSHHLHAHLLKSKLELKALLEQYDHIVTTWRTMVGLAYTLDYAMAATHIKELRRYAREFRKLCQEVSTAVEHLQCTGRTRDPSAQHTSKVLMGSALVAVAATLYAIFPRLRRPKPKSNQW